MKNFLITLICIVAGMCFIAGVMLTCVELVVFDESRFHTAYQEYNRYEYIGISEDDLHMVTHELLEYMHGNRDDIVMYADIDGEQEMVFQEREQLHMVDVRKLCDIGFDIRKYGFIASVALVLLALFIGKEKALRQMGIGILISQGIFIALIASLVVAMLRDFSAMFTKFHLLLFDNDLWLLDPNTDIMINMFPEEFFNSLGLAIGIYCGIGLLVMTIGAITSLIVLKKARSNEQ